MINEININNQLIENQNNRQEPKKQDKISNKTVRFIKDKFSILVDAPNKISKGASQYVFLGLNYGIDFPGRAKVAKCIAALVRGTMFSLAIIFLIPIALIGIAALSGGSISMLGILLATIPFWLAAVIVYHHMKKEIQEFKQEIKEKEQNFQRLLREKDNDLQNICKVKHLAIHQLMDIKNETINEKIDQLEKKADGKFVQLAELVQDIAEELPMTSEAKTRQSEIARPQRDPFSLYQGLYPHWEAQEESNR